MGAAAVAALLTASACASPVRELPKLLRPSGQQLLLKVSEGTVTEHDWQVELIRQDTQTCLQAVVDYKSMAIECGFQTGDNLPVNLAVAGNDNIIFMYGAVSPAVQSLDLQSKVDGTQQLTFRTTTTDPTRYYGGAIKPAEFSDLTARDDFGKVIFSGRDKVVGTLAGRHASPQPSEGPTR